MMNYWRILFILGLCLICTQSIYDIITTSHSESPQLINGQLKKIVPKQHFCTEGIFQKLTCPSKSKNACKGVSLSELSPICGFDNLGQKLQFKRQCQACQNFQIKYYFKGTCNQAPKICKRTEECINGLCIEILQQALDLNRIICNTKADCPSTYDICVANKCIDKRELMGKLKEVEKKNPKFAEKNIKMRGEAMKHYQQIKQKGANDIEKLKAINQAKQQKATQAVLNQTAAAKNLKSNVGLN